MKSIFKSHLNGGANLLKNKKLLFAAVLSSVAINCDATLQRIDNAHKKEDTRIFYQIQRKVAGKKYVKAMRDLAVFEALIDTTQQAWDNRDQKYFFKLVDYNSLQKHGIEDDVCLQTSLVFAYIAWESFQMQLPINIAGVKMAANMFCNRYAWKGQLEKLTTNLTFYLFDKRWIAAFWINSINIYENAEDKNIAIKSLRKKFIEKICDAKFECIHLQIVSMYLKNQNEFKRFKMVSKKCARAVNELHFNPIRITRYMSDELVLALFPNIQTQFLYHIYDRKINIVNEHGINLDGYDIKYTITNDGDCLNDPLLQYLYVKGGLYMDIFFRRLHGKNIKFSKSPTYKYRFYVNQKTQLEDLDIEYKRLVKLVFETKEVLTKFEKEEVLPEVQGELPDNNIKIRFSKCLCELLLDKSKLVLDNKLKLAELMKQFIVNINWNEWDALGEEKRKELEWQKKSGKIKGIVKHFCPRHQQDFERYIVGTTFAVPRGVDYIKLQHIDADVKSQIERIEIPESVKIIAPFCFRSYENVTEIIFARAGITFEGDDTFKNCPSILRIYVIDAAEYGKIKRFKEKLIRAGLDENVDVIEIEYEWSVIDFPFFSEEIDKPFVESA